LRIAIEQDVKTLNPTLSATTVDNFVQRLMFEPLISADAHGTPVPILAAGVPSLANGGISRDGLTVVYHLRRSPHWSDGVAVTSADVKFSWSAIMNPNNNAVSRHGYDDVAAIDTPGPYTVVVHLKHPFAPFVNTFFAESDQPYMIVPAHVLAESLVEARIAEHRCHVDGEIEQQLLHHCRLVQHALLEGAHARESFLLDALPQPAPDRCVRVGAEIKSVLTEDSLQ
jgi:ABC-type transport system substrate-binding protein